MSNYNQMTIDLSAIEKNFDAFGDTPIMPMVIKGSGHGTDAIELARFFEKRAVPFLGVSHLSEAIDLRKADIRTPIFLLSFLPEEAELIVSNRITPAVDTLEKVEAIRRAARGSYPVHLNIDTGLGRFGARIEEAPLLMHRIEQELELDGVMTHFAACEDPAFDAFSQQQIEKFRPFAGKARWTHASSSYAQMRFSLPFCNLSRIGLFCLLPNPSIQLHATIMGIKTMKRGESVGYGCQYRVEKEQIKMAIISLGYHDGWHLSYSEKGRIYLHGRYAPMIGRICMDFQMIDISAIDGAKVGDLVELIGPHLPLNEVAKTFEVNPRQLLASLGSRITRRFIHEQQSVQRAL